MDRPVLVDCDPGTDDALAIALVAIASELTMSAVTTVGGNQTLEKTTKNALGLLSLCDRPAVPVSPGYAEPMARDLVPAADVHGESGLAGTDLPEEGLEPTDRHAIDTIYETAVDEDGLTVLAIGPLTNVAMAIRRYPDLVDLLEEIVVMGGSITGGNVTPAAEFNVHTDPEAAQIVFDAPVSTTMIGLDVTRAARIDPEFNAAIREVGAPVTDVLADLVDHLLGIHADRYGWTSAPIHDALAAASLVEPEVLTSERMRVDVERSGAVTTGATVCDRLGASDRPPNVDVATAVDAAGFEALLIEQLQDYA